MQESIPSGVDMLALPLPTDVEIHPDAGGVNCCRSNIEPFESYGPASIHLPVGSASVEARQTMATQAESARSQKRRVRIAGIQQELEFFASEGVEPLAVPADKDTKRLAGNCSSIRIRKNPDSVVVADPNLVPPAFKHAVITMPAYVWEALLQCLYPEERTEFEPLIDKLEFKPDKKAIGAELKNGTKIPGAELRCGDWRLVLS